MGFFDLLGDLADIGKDIVALPFKIAGAAIETATDINEMIVQDVKNKVSGTPDKPIRTSYDIRNEADKIVESAKNKFYDAKSKLTSSWHKTSRKAEQVARKRQEVYQLLGQAVSTTLVKLPEQPIELIYPSGTPYIDSSFNIGTFFGLLGTDTRMVAAEEYLQRAKEYRADVNSLINEVEALRQTVLRVSNAQKEEMEILDVIQSVYRMKNKDVLTESAELLHEIAMLCVQEMSANTDVKYNDLLKHLKSLWH